MRRLLLLYAALKTDMPETLHIPACTSRCTAVTRYCPHRCHAVGSMILLKLGGDFPRSVSRIREISKSRSSPHRKFSNDRRKSAQQSRLALRGCMYFRRCSAVGKELLRFIPMCVLSNDQNEQHSRASCRKTNLKFTHVRSNFLKRVVE